MLVLKRREGQWIEIVHRSGDRLRVRVYNIRSRFPGRLDLAFDDAAGCFAVLRPESSPAPGPRGDQPPGTERRARTRCPTVSLGIPVRLRRRARRS